MSAPLLVPPPLDAHPGLSPVCATCLGGPEVDQVEPCRSCGVPVHNGCPCLCGVDFSVENERQAREELNDYANYDSEVELVVSQARAIVERTTDQQERQRLLRMLALDQLAFMMRVSDAKALLAASR